MIQDNIIINRIKVPIIKEENNIYYPVSFLGSKVLLKDLTPSQLKKNGYDKYIKQFEINFRENTGGIQLTYCIREDGLKKLVKNSKIGRLSEEQKICLNKLYEYLNIKIKIDIKERYIDKLDDEEIKKYNIFIQDCIYETLKVYPDVKYQKCTKCNNYYPCTKDFFSENQHSSAELNTCCKSCQAWSESRTRIAITHPNKELNSVYKKYGEDIYLLYKSHSTIDIYKHYINNKIERCPNILRNKKDYLEIIKFHYNMNLLTDVSIGNIEKELRLPRLYQFISLDELYECLFGNDYKLYPWKYPLLRLNNITLEEAKIIFFNYCNENNIKISNVYDLDYTDIIIRCGLKCYAADDILGFVMKLWDNKYGAYKFKTVGQNYWKVKENANQALKYYIEEDQNIPIEKIPLYITLNNLQKNSKTLYNIIYRKKFHKTLYEWINDIYPNTFEEKDFNIGSIRNYFDSNEEEIIYNYLKDIFKNVIYNKRNCENTINFKGIIPDFIIFTDNACYLVEYFGLYAPEKAGNSKRIADYVKKTEVKINKYKTIKYNKIFIYPNDLLDGMKGLQQKVNKII